MRSAGDACGCFPTGRHYAAIAHLLRTRVAGLASEFDQGAAWAELSVVMIDVETTGREPSTDRIVELAIVSGRRGEVTSRNAWLINPTRPIPKEASAVHGITDGDVADKPTFENVAKEIMAALQRAIPGAYNAPFDRGFLHAEAARASVDDTALPPALRPDIEWMDPLIWARHIQATAKSRALGDVAARRGVVRDLAPRDPAEAEPALRVLFSFAEDPRVPRGYGAFIQEQVRLGRAQEEARQMWRGRG